MKQPDIGDYETSKTGLKAEDDGVKIEAKVDMSDPDAL